MKLPEKTIKLFVGIGLVIAAFLNFMGQMNWIPSNGTASELYGGKLILAGFLLFVYGASNNIGIGSYALTMSNCLLARLESSCSLSYYDGGLYILYTDGQATH